ncbi:hypothetical protein H0I23_13270 [Cellulophaga sp. HaHaR_3_176]|uniref:hypothetical protein n=1 Tax=Cellulophaga sp. HaHaR_3_176 TaxID=1942464 RepID=UPI001C1F6296|nr:hypothetical protein [Cellulophaga sp. HaHaR_3_176]QWX83416.1 hypothetical protein H0I23_13270 [Cellulophaga sp. HaHaR_3_176]
MNSLKTSKYYSEIITELNYPFGDYYLFDGFIVAEIEEGIIYTWENQGEMITTEIANLYDNNGGKLIYITNRINTYSVKPADWIRFYKMKYNLLGYAIVSYSEKGWKNAILEKIFTKNKIERFNSLDNAIEWAKEKISKESA